MKNIKTKKYTVTLEIDLTYNDNGSPNIEEALHKNIIDRVKNAAILQMKGFSTKVAKIE